MSIRSSRPAVLSLLCGLTVILQLGPVYWPGPGYVLAMGTTLPSALATAMASRRCTWFYAATALVLGLTAVEEMFVFLLVTGPLGLNLGLLVDKPAWAAVTLGAACLAGGMALLPLVAGISALGGLEAGWSPACRLAWLSLFALVYTTAWRRLFGAIWARFWAGRSATRSG